MKGPVPTVSKQVNPVFVFSDSGHSSHGTSAKGERLSAKMRALPGSNEPYEASSQRDIGETHTHTPSLHFQSFRLAV